MYDHSFMEIRYFPGGGWVAGWVGCEIKNKANLSPAELELGLSLAIIDILQMCNECLFTNGHFCLQTDLAGPCLHCSLHGGS